MSSTTGDWPPRSVARGIPAGHGTGTAKAARSASPRPRLAWADNLRTTLVCGVIVGHVTMAWTGLPGWVFSEPPVRDPLLTVLLLACIIGVTFGMPTFFLVAGLFTPASLERKGSGRFIADRALRLLVPSLAFVLLLTPPIEYADPENAGWQGTFWEFVPHVLTDWPPAPGPTWFLGILFAFSVGYAGWRAWHPRVRHTGDTEDQWDQEQWDQDQLGQDQWDHRGPGGPVGLVLLMTVAALVALASYAVRIVVPLGQEWWHLAVGQAPGWVAGFGLGVAAAERGWLGATGPDARGSGSGPGPACLPSLVRRLGWAALAACAMLVGGSAAFGMPLEEALGGGTWQSMAFTLVEATIVVTVPLWIVDLFRRRFDRSGRLGAELGRASFAAFLVHQGVLVALVLASHQVVWPPEVEFLGVALGGVVLSFGVGAVLVRLPGLSRVL